MDQNYCSGIKVYGSCNGLLCLSDTLLHRNNVIFSCNPIIRKVKKIPMIPIEVHDSVEDEAMENAELFFGYYADEAELSFGYFDDDYKVIRIAEFCCMYRVGVYSLSIDCWKFVYCESDDGTFKSYNIASSKCVNGVAYFVKYEGRLVCLICTMRGLEKSNFQNVFFLNLGCLKLEAYGESIALVETTLEHLVKWKLKNCGATKTPTWEKKVIIEFPSGVYLHLTGFTIDGTYLLKRFNYFYMIFTCAILKHHSWRNTHVTMCQKQP